MKFYLSSYKLGDELGRLRGLIPPNRRTAYVPNALDFASDLARRKKGEEADVKDLEGVGLDVERIDLRDFFGQQERLAKKIDEFGVIWVRGGNLFVLRQAFRLSGFDEIVKRLNEREDLLYGGYSAGVCILAPTLKGIDLMDDLTAKPYGAEHETIWEGLGILDYSIVPHYRSNHPESEMANRVVEYMVDNKMLFRALRDGEVIIMN